MSQTPAGVSTSLDASVVRCRKLLDVVGPRHDDMGQLERLGGGGIDLDRRARGVVVDCVLR